MTHSRLSLIVVSSVLGAALSAPVQAQPAAWPSKPITLIVPFAAGGTNDILARVVGAKLSNRYGVPVVVENRPGAGGNIGGRAVAQAPGDGYTLGAVSVGVLAINQWVYPDIGFDPEKELTPIALAGHVPNVLVANPALPAKSVKELIAYAKQHPGKLNFASMGTGTTGHLCGELFRLETGIDVEHVPYKGAAPALADLIAGHVGLMCDNLTNALPHIQAGKLRALAVTSKARSEMLPDVPTLNEAGVKGFEATAWFGFVGPGSMKPELVERLHQDFAAALADQDVRERLSKQGLGIEAMSQAEFKAFAGSEAKKWKTVVERAGAGKP